MVEQISPISPLFHLVHSAMDSRGEVLSEKDQLTLAIVKHDLPFQFAEYEYFRNYVRHFNPSAQLFSPDSIRVNLETMFAARKDSMKHDLGKLTSKVSITMDILSGVQYILLAWIGLEDAFIHSRFCSTEWRSQWLEHL